MRGAALLDTELVAGRYWGKRLEESLDGLGLAKGPADKKLGPFWYVEQALPRLWGLGAGKSRRARIRRVEVGEGAWLMTERGKVFGYMVQVPVADWDLYEVPARKRFGKPEKLHFTVERSTGPGETKRFMHFYRWGDEDTQFLFLKGTFQDTASFWYHRQIQSTFRVRILHKVEDPDVPLFVGAFDRDWLKEIGVEYVGPHGGNGHGREH